LQIVAHFNPAVPLSNPPFLQLNAQAEPPKPKSLRTMG
jgi:hypothetical protein